MSGWSGCTATTDPDTGGSVEPPGSRDYLMRPIARSFFSTVPNMPV